MRGTIRIKLFGHDKSEEDVNEWIWTALDIEIVDIKISTTGNQTHGIGVTVMVIYREL